MRKIFILCLFSIFSLSNDSFSLIGNPYIEKYKDGEKIYARNIWDMQLFNGEIYIGAGNSSNEGPAQNAGRIPVFSIDPKTDKFSFEYEVAEEQIDLLKVYNNSLFIPGHDATEKWEFGNIYKKSNEKWNKYRTLPNALHVYDLVLKDEKIFTAVGLNKFGAVFISDMNANNWEEVSQGSGRVYSFLEVGNELFATKTFKANNMDKISVTQWEKSKNSFLDRTDLNTHKMFPNTKLENKSIKIIKPLKFDDKNSFYIGAYKHNDHQNLPFSLYQASINNKELYISKVEIEKDFIPRDIIKQNNELYLLVNRNDIIMVLKFKEGNFSRYEEIISFSYKTFARSFEKVNNCFYFGMGSEIEDSDSWNQTELKKETGEILKVCK